MIEGLLLGTMSWLSLLLSWYHLPGWAKRWTLRHPVVSDILAGISAWFFLTAISRSIVAVIGSTVAGLLVNFSLMGYSYFIKEHFGKQNQERRPPPVTNRR